MIEKYIKWPALADSFRKDLARLDPSAVIELVSSNELTD